MEVSECERPFDEPRRRPTDDRPQRKDVLISLRQGHDLAPPGPSGPIHATPVRDRQEPAPHLRQSWHPRSEDRPIKRHREAAAQHARCRCLASKPNSVLSDKWKRTTERRAGCRHSTTAPTDQSANRPTRPRHANTRSAGPKWPLPELQATGILDQSRRCASCWFCTCPVAWGTRPRALTLATVKTGARHMADIWTNGQDR